MAMAQDPVPVMDPLGLVILQMHPMGLGPVIQGLGEVVAAAAAEKMEVVELGLGWVPVIVALLASMVEGIQMQEVVAPAVALEEVPKTVVVLVRDQEGV